MIDKPNPADFSVDEMTGKYRVRFLVSGVFETEINAANDAEARVQAEQMMDEDNCGIELTDVNDISISYIVKEKPRYRVLRDGHVMQVTVLKPGDMPREPDKLSGF